MSEHIVGVGIEPIKKKDRMLGLTEVFLIWAGGQILPSGFLTGGSMGPGIGAVAVFWVVLASNILGYIPLAYLAVASARYGIEQYVACRPSFGLRGSWLGSLLVIITNAGWVGVMGVLGGTSADIVYKSFYPDSSAFLFFAIVSGVLIPWFIGVWGPVSIKWMEKIAVPILILLSIAMMIASLRAAGGWEGLKAIPPKGDIGLPTALEYGIAYAISWLPYVGAWAKLANTERAASWGTYLALSIIGGWFYFTGAISAIFTGDPDPTSWMIPLGLGMPALLVVIGGTVTTNSMLTYSAAQGLQQWFPYFVGKYKLAYTLTFAPGLFFIVFSKLVTEYGSWLGFIGALWGPFFGVVLADFFFLRKQRFELKEIYAKGGKYWYYGGFNVIALIVWAIGVKLYYVILESPLFPYITATLPAMIITGIIYFIVGKLVIKPLGQGGY